ncbi:hypothetical protein ES706_05264 [subsurface metagenome]
MRIEVTQLPPPECSPNWRGFWPERYKAARTYQAAVFYECVDMRNKLTRLPWRPGFPPFDKARLTLTFIFPSSHERDEDNLRTMFKPGQDALVQAELIKGDTPTHLVLGEINIIIDRQRAPLTIIELEEVKDVSNST